MAGNTGLVHNLLPVEAGHRNYYFVVVHILSILGFCDGDDDEYFRLLLHFLDFPV